MKTPKIDVYAEIILCNSHACTLIPHYQGFRLTKVNTKGRLTESPLQKFIVSTFDISRDVELNPSQISRSSWFRSRTSCLVCHSEGAFFATEESLRWCQRPFACPFATLGASAQGDTIKIISSTFYISPDAGSDPSRTFPSSWLRNPTSCRGTSSQWTRLRRR